MDFVKSQKQTTISEGKINTAYRMKPTQQSKDAYQRSNFLPVSMPTSAQGVYMNASNTNFSNFGISQTFLQV